jgi:hypothetical protein
VIWSGTPTKMPQSCCAGRLASTPAPRRFCNAHGAGLIPNSHADLTAREHYIVLLTGTIDFEDENDELIMCHLIFEATDFDTEVSEKTALKAPINTFKPELIDCLYDELMAKTKTTRRQTAHEVHKGQLTKMT